MASSAKEIKVQTYKARSKFLKESVTAIREPRRRAATRKETPSDNAFGVTYVFPAAPVQRN